MSWFRLDETVYSELKSADVLVRAGQYIYASDTVLRAIKELKSVYEKRRRKDDRRVLLQLEGIESVVSDLAKQDFLRDISYNQYLSRYFSYIITYVERAYWYRYWEVNPDELDYESQDEIFNQLVYSYQRLSNRKSVVERILKQIRIEHNSESSQKAPA